MSPRFDIIARRTARANWPLLLLAVGLFGAALVRAQVAITAVTTTTNTTAGNTTEGGTNPATITFQNDIRALTTYTAGGNVYTAGAAANNVFIRRNTTAGNTNRTSLWMENAPGVDTVIGTDRDTFGSVLLDNNFFQGADNVFSNGTGTAQGDIERVDFVWSSGFTVTNTLDGLAFFERGAAGAHDGFQIALITSLGSGLASPLTWTFANVLRVTSTNYGANNLDITNDGTVDTLGYRLLRYTTGDTLTAHAAANETGSQGIGGVHISFADLGLAQNTVIYGYAVMATDVNTTASNLVNWNNTTFFPTNTADAAGGIDFAAFGGQRSIYVPEPSTYGAMLVLGVGALLYWRRCARSAPPAS
jgi:hypothetical protein